MANYPKRSSGSSLTPARIARAILRGIGSFFLLIFRMVIIFGCFGVIAGSIVAVMMSLYVVEATAEDDKILDLGSLKLSYTTILYAKNPSTGEYEEYERLVDDENRIWVNFDDISPNMINAITAVEDDSFWEHNGVNYVRTVAAAVNEYTPLKILGGGTQGASTITQQLVKNITNENEVDAMRKIREIFRAMALENRYSKEVIMEAYLNVFRLSGNIAGVEAAANIYFGKSASDLSVTESAMIAGITQSPVQYNPYENPENCLDRRNTVLYHMNRVGHLTDEEYEFAVEQPLGLISTSEPVTTEIVVETEDGEIVETTDEEMLDAAVEGETPEQSESSVSVDEDGTIVRTKAVYSWYTDMVISDVIDDFVEQKGMSREEASDLVYNGGLRIYLPIDLTLQQAMDDLYTDPAVYRQFYPEMLDDKKDFYGELILDEQGNTIPVTPEVAMVSVNMVGEIVAVIGGFDEKEEDRVLNRAVDSVRQTGSTMKPIGSYAPALDYNYIYYSKTFRDSPLEPSPATGNVSWPHNYGGTTSGNMITVQSAISRSLNTIAVRVLDQFGVQSSFDFLTETLQISSLYESLEVDGQIMTDLGLAPLALGAMTEGVAPMEMAAAYSIFGNGGKFTTPHSYTSIEDFNGEPVMEPIVTTSQAIKPETAMIMNKMLETVLSQAGGTGYGMMPERIPAVGKTGTTSDDKDHWFIGVTPYYSTATWWGYDDPQELEWKGSDYDIHPPTMAWEYVMNDAQSDLEFLAFPTSENVVEMAYCTHTGMLAAADCPRGTGYYKRDNPPPVCTGGHVDPNAVPVV